MFGLLIAGLLGATAYVAKSIYDDHRHLRTADREAAALSLSNQQQLNEEEFERKQEFYEQYESPAAQVRQYKDAGLNPMLLGGGAGVSASGGIGSAGSAPASNTLSSGMDFGSLISSVLGYDMQQKQMKQQKDIVDKEIALKRELGLGELAVHQSQADALNRYYSSLATGQDNENRVFDTVFGWRARAAQDEHNFKVEETNRLKVLIESDRVQKQLLEKNLEIADVDLAIKQFMEAQERAKAKYADEYWKATAEIQTATAFLQQGQANIFRETWEKQLDAARASLQHIIVKAGMDEEIFNSEAFKRHNQGVMTRSEKWGAWSNVASTIIGAVTAIAVPYAGAMAGAKGIFAPTLPQSTFIPYGPANNYGQPYN